MSITWNGVSSDTIGVVVERIPNRYVPTRRFSPQQVAGRNGNILLVDKAFPNVEQEYEVYLSAEAQGLPSVARACAEWLMGPDGYCRLTDSYDTTVYREAFLMGGYDLENILNKFGRCTITFSCKPQKYLLTGDTPIEIPVGTTTTYTGDVVQFDGVTGASITSLSTTLSPIQDLHGYSNPWPAGGGKQLLDPSKFIQNPISQSGIDVINNGDGTFTVKGTATATIYTPLINYQYLSDYEFIEPNVSYTLSGYYNSNVYVGFGISGAGTDYWASTSGGRTMTFTAEDISAKKYRLVIRVNSGEVLGDTGIIIKPMICKSSASNPSTFSPYSNICPISGRTSASAWRTGKNLLDGEDFADYSSWSSVAPYGTYATSSGTLGYSLNTVEGGTYTLSFGLSADDIPVYLYLCRGNGTDTTELVQRFTAGASDPIYATKKTFTAEAGWLYYIRLYTNNETYFDGQIAKLSYEQLELGSTATDYEPYSGTTIAVDWTTEAGTVYGGTLDVVTGVLTVDRASVSLDGSNDEQWGFTGGYTNRAKITISANSGDKTKQSANYLIATDWGITKYTFGLRSDGNLYITLDNTAPQMTIEEFRLYLSSNPLQLVYELATPLTYQLTAQEVEALVGTNNVWSSSGDVSVTVVTPLGGIVTNPTPFEARPLLTVSGVGEITVNGKSIQILESVSDFEIDCETMEAEDNSKIYCMDFPDLSGGENEIVSNGSITSLTVVPRWWTL